MGGVDEELRFIQQVAAPIRIVRLSGLLMCIEEILGELAAGKRIPEQSCLEESRAKFGDDLYGIVRNIHILNLHQCFCAQQHRPESFQAGLLEAPCL